MSRFPMRMPLETHLLASHAILESSLPQRVTKPQEGAIRQVTNVQRGRTVSQMKEEKRSKREMVSQTTCQTALGCFGSVLADV
ncbi:hypothetical protein CDAR_572911 [Caerostris darwini]|uniref:Uncharacterized protein n=1 Tax=Caerostris darwini TaxID=1538125 RepID=A0AAV4W7Q9_9ARAC|nr:hypothetical protein CDAR_572911 [Caerostris darwini]